MTPSVTKGFRLFAPAVLILGVSTASKATALPKLSVSDVTVSEVSCNSQVATFTVSISAPFGKTTPQSVGR